MERHRRPCRELLPSSSLLLQRGLSTARSQDPRSHRSSSLVALGAGDGSWWTLATYLTSDMRFMPAPRGEGRHCFLPPTAGSPSFLLTDPPFRLGIRWRHAQHWGMAPSGLKPTPSGAARREAPGEDVAAEGPPLLRLEPH